MRLRLAWSGAFALLALACGGSGSPAKTAEEANRQYDLEEYDAAADLYEEACDGGEASACTQLGGMHELGEGVSADFGAARELYAKGCHGKDGRGCTLLGRLYLQGRGVAKNDEEATRAFEQACEAGHPAGCGEYGTSLWRGRGLQADPKRAKEILKKSCAHGYGEGCFALGVLFRMGDEGVPKNARSADAFLRRGCELGAGESCAYRKKYRAALKREAALQAGSTDEPAEDGAGEGNAEDAEQE